MKEVNRKISLKIRPLQQSKKLILKLLITNVQLNQALKHREPPFGLISTHLACLTENTLFKFIQIVGLPIKVSASSWRHLHDQWELVKLQILELVGILVNFMLEVAQVELRVQQAHIIGEQES